MLQRDLAMTFRRVVGWRATVVGLWCAAALATGVLALVRYRAGVADFWYDFDTYFLPAAQRVVAGGSPYEVPGYVYSPLVALLIAPMSHWPDAARVWAAASIAAAVVAVTFATLALRDRRRPWLTPILFGFGMVTLFYNWPTTLVLWLGQTDLMVLAAVAFAAWGAARGRSAPTAFGLVTAALIKTWPVVTGVWLLRRDSPDRMRTLAWTAVVGVAGIAATAVVLGPGELFAWGSAVAGARTQPHIIHFSAFSFGEQLFGTATGTVALVVDPRASLAATGAFGLATATFLAMTLWWPGDPALALWHTLLACVLLLPVSHAAYLLYGLPILWTWAARVLAGDWRRPSSVILLGFLLGWWVIAFRVPWPGDMGTSMPTLGYAAVMLSTLGALGLSVTAEARRRRPT